MSSSGEPASESLELDDILDVAADAFVNDGFDALSFRHVASRLEVDESEVREFFDTVEQMLISMLNREYGRMFRDIVDNIERDPLGGRLSRIYRYVLSGVYERPLAKALYLMDRDGLNRIMRATHGFSYIPQLGVRSDFIDRMKEAGVVREDVDSAAISALISAVSAGAALQAPHTHLDDLIEGLGTLLERGVDTDETDTTRAKATFFRFAASLAGGSGKDDAGGGGAGKPGTTHD
jgi:AcrR family transcriptional regulator